MIFKRFDGFEVTPTDTIVQTLADAKVKVEQLQAQEAGNVA